MIQSHVSGCACCFGNPRPPPLTLISYMASLRDLWNCFCSLKSGWSRQMIEIHFLSGKIISLSLQCHPFLPHPSPLNTAPSPSPTNSETRSCSFLCRIFPGIFSRCEPRLSDTILSTGRSSLHPSGAGGFAQARSTLQKRQTARITPKAKHFQQICIA